MGPDLNVTLIVDASWCPETRAGAWAMWAKSGIEKRVAQYRFKRLMSNSFQAEMAAITNGVHFVLRNMKCGRLLVQSDCTSAINALSSYPQRVIPDAFAAEIAASYLALVRRYAVPIDFRHIKGHSGNSTPRTWVHSEVDRAARKLMKRQRLALKGVILDQGGSNLGTDTPQEGV